MGLEIKKTIFSEFLVNKEMHLFCMVRDYGSIKQVDLLQARAWRWKIFALWLKFSLPHLPLPPPGRVCVCVISPFEPIVSDAFGPMTHAVCSGSVTPAPG